MSIVMVTGASRGIGAAVVEMLHKRGDEVYGVGRDPERLAAQGVHPVIADLAHPETLADAMPQLERLDALVHCAGVCTLGRIAETPYRVWHEHLTVNLAAAAEITRLMLPALRRAFGQVVFVNSGAGQHANPNWGAYAASKFGLRALADALRAEERSLRVTSIYPGRTDTEMQQSVRQQEGGEYQPERYLRPQTVAHAVITALDTPPDGHLGDLTLRPQHRA